MFQEDIRLFLFSVEPSSIQTTSLDQFKNVQAMLSMYRDIQQLFHELLPEFCQKLVVIECCKEMLADQVEESDHLHEMDVIFLLFDLFFTHHLHFHRYSDVNLLWLDVLLFVDTSLDQHLFPILKIFLGFSSAFENLI